MPPVFKASTATGIAGDAAHDFEWGFALRAAVAWSPQIPGPEAGSGQLTRKNAFGRARAACTAASGNVLNLPFQGPVLAVHAEDQEWQATFVTHGEISRGASWFTARCRFSTTGQRVMLARDRSLRACHGPEKLQVRLLVHGRARSLPQRTVHD